MTNFYMLSMPQRTILVAVFFVVLCLGICSIPIVFGREKRYLLKSFVLVCDLFCAASVVLYACDMRAVKLGQELLSINQWFMQMPVIVSLLGLVLTVAVIAAIMAGERNYRETSITSSSIKESIDHFTLGLCFAKKNGVILLANHQMEQLCRRILDTDLQNAELFWEKLSGGITKEKLTYLETGETPVFCLEDRSVWRFERSFLEEVVQLSAVDVTRLYQLQEELEEQNKELEALNQRLVEYGNSVEEVTRMKEYLDTKARIHNEMGQVLLATKYYLKEKQKTPQPVLEMWRRTLNIARHEKEYEKAADPAAEILNAARFVGVDVDITGEFPKEKEICRLFMTGAVEVLTNAVVHAKADKVSMKLFEQNDHYVVEFSNNGELPSSSVAEGGGVGSLRKKTEALGGKMHIVCDEAFVLTLQIAKELSCIW